MRLYKTALMMAGALAGVYLGASASMAISMGRRSRRLALNDTPRAVGMDYRDVEFPSRRGRGETERKLRGWLIPSRVDGAIAKARATRWVVIVHGESSNRTDPQSGALGLASDLNGLGYGILMFDLRGCGDSSEGRFTAGWDERLDVLGALDCLVDLGADRSRIGIIGFSLGAVASGLACSTPGVAAALVSDSAFADLWSMIQGSASTRMQAAFTSLVRPGMDFFLHRLYGYRLTDVVLAERMAESDTPTLIIHGASDQVVPPQNAYALARARGVSQRAIDAGASDDFWLVSDTGHTQAYRKDPDRYVARVSAFFNRYLAA